MGPRPGGSDESLPEGTLHGTEWQRNRLKYSVDSHHIRPWAERIGKLILSFSGLELESHIWLVQMSGQPDRIAEFANPRFSKRVYQLQACVEARAFSPA
jgi:hypothetical protein